MHITSLDLENIKSYSRATLDFSQGVNAICGLNGSGKTTVLEAIGFALFDYLPYPHAAFIREGEKSGTVRVRMMARDGREYEVVRPVGSSAGYYVADVETGTRLAERGPNVLDWIATHALGIDGEAHLDTLFKDAVGVPQGKMTADFGGTALQRKAVFDPLLRVEEYRNAFETLRETVSHVRDLSAQKREEAARLETLTSAIPEKRQEQARLEAERGRIEANLVRIAAELAEAAEQKTVLDEAEELVRQLRHDVALVATDVQHRRETRGELEKALGAAEEARRAMQESEPGYRRAVAARERLKTLETQRQERDGLNAQLTGAQSDQRGVFGRIEALDEEVRQATSAGERAAALVDSVAKQTSLDDRLQELRGRLREVASLEQQAGKTRREAETLEGTCASRDEALTRARAAQDEVAHLPEVQESLRTAGEQLAALAPLRDELGRVREEGVRLRKQYDDLSEDLRRHEEMSGRASALAVEADGFDGLARQSEELRQELTQVTAAIDYQTVARAELERQRCPLLELRCPVVESDSAMLERFDGSVSTLAARAAELEGKLAALAPRLEGARKAGQSLQELRVRMAGLERSRAQRDAMEGDLERCRLRFTELSAQLSAEGQLRARQGELDARMRALQAAAQQASRLGLLEEQQERDRARLEAERRELDALERRREELTALERQERELRAELESLGDPRQEQQNLLALANRRPQLESEVEKRQEQLAEISGRVKAIVGKLTAFETLDQEMAEQRAVEQEHQASFERYLANRDEAESLAERKRALAAAEQALAGAEQKERDLKERLEAALACYDAERHAFLAGRCEELNAEMTRESTNGEHCLKALGIVEEELERLRRQEVALGAIRAELGELDRIAVAVSFIRETIKAAGPAITETLLSNISQTANDIYAEIMDDHAAELRWDKDYEVLVQRGPETRKFSQLSGGEQMSAALAVRLALLKEMSEVNFAFFDEPTQNMDVERRSNLADQIRAVRGFNQLIVISHDDTFEHHTDNLIRLRKVHEETELEAG